MKQLLQPVPRALGWAPDSLIRGRSFNQHSLLEYL